MPSPYVNRLFIEGNYYHLYNRGANKQKIFRSPEDYLTFLNILDYYLINPVGKPLSHLDRYQSLPANIQGRTLDTITSSFQLLCYCLMPNHFHFLIKQLCPSNNSNSVSNFFKRLSVAYAMYFNHKYSHSGNIYQGKYKSVTIGSDRHLIYVSKYIHLNPQTILSPKTTLCSYPYSSYSSYLFPQSQTSHTNVTDILNYFSNEMPHLRYKNFVEETDTQFDSLHPLLLDHSQPYVKSIRPGSPLT